jgi:1-acyl-sn-glycerol-3-phosphate acyltransferase
MSRATSLGRSIKALQSKRSIIIFPEGGIVSDQFPFMGKPLMDGAFIMAVQQQVPVVPISFFNNHHLLNDRTFLLRPGVIKVEIHAPVETIGLSNEDVPVLRDKVFDMIQNPILAFYGTDAPH